MEKKSISKKSQSSVVIIVMIVGIGLALFFGIRYLIDYNNNKNKMPLNVTLLPDEVVTSTAIKFVNRAGAVNITNGQNLVLKNPVVNIEVNNTNKTLLKIIYPNRTLTPGAIMSSDLATLCDKNYSDLIIELKPSQNTINKVFDRYKLSSEQPEGAFEIDALVPLEIGGSNEIRNLWPQPKEPRPGYIEKNVIEKYLHEQVCDGKIDLEEAQAKMANSWFNAYLEYKEKGGW